MMIGCGRSVEPQTEAEIDTVSTIVASTMQAMSNDTKEVSTEIPTGSPEVGTRSNPVPLGQPLGLVYQNIANFQITILEVMRGQDAWNMISQANMFNEQPSEGMEYILAKVGITHQTSTQQDYTLSIDSFYFKSVSNNQILDSPSIVEPEPELNANLFPGGYGEGYITVLTYADDPAPLIVFEDWISFDSNPFYFATIR
ncbi:MAG: hypothetical protein AB2L18_06405 [Anaerolineaceae bacterium]